MVNTIRNNTELQEELVVQLMCYNDLTAAAEWSRRFDIPTDRLPAAVVGERDRLHQEARYGWGVWVCVGMFVYYLFVCF